MQRTTRTSRGLVNAMLHKIPSLFPWKHNKTKTMAEPVLEEDVNLEDQLAPCTICGRTFLPNPLSKHSKVCERNATKKRKVFNSLKQRVEGTDLAPFHQQAYLKKPEPPNGRIERTAWKETHQELVTTIREAKNITVKESVTTPQKQRSLSIMNANFERCLTCDRQFGPKAYDRHVEWCKERKNRLPQSPANVEQAKQRLEARIKYRVPPLSKPKMTNKERYQSPMKAQQPMRAPEPPLTMSVKSSTNLDRRPSVKAAERKVEKVEVKPHRGERLKRDDTYNPILTAERQLMELLECDDFKAFTPSKQRAKVTHNETTTAKSTKKYKRASVIDPPTDFQDKSHSPDIFDDNFELIENFINDNLSDDTILDKLDAISLSSQKAFAAENENFGAFCDDLSIDPRLINECDNLSIPDGLTVEDRSPAEGKYAKLPAVLKSEKCVNLNEMDELIASVAQTQPQKALKTQQSCSFGGGDAKKKNLSSLKRSISALDPLKPKNLRNKEDVQTYFHEQEIRNSPKNNNKKKEDGYFHEQEVRNSPKNNTKKKEDSYFHDQEIRNSPKSNVRRKEPVNVSAVSEELFSIDDEMYEEYKKYEQMYLQEKEEKLKMERRSLEDDGQISKISADSAYGSLSRNKPKVRTRVQRLSPLDVRADSASSSGSETSLAQNNSAKFCHECGSKYPLNTAKFCVECGVKRLVL